jgi:hypothetical protein
MGGEEGFRVAQPVEVRWPFEIQIDCLWDLSEELFGQRRFPTLAWTEEANGWELGEPAANFSGESALDHPCKLKVRF